MAAAGDDGIMTHRDVKVNGVRLHVAEAGPAVGPVALLLHGYPELWYTWRHQTPALAAAGYRAVAPDLRGYGGSTDARAAGPQQYIALHVVGDLVPGGPCRLPRPRQGVRGCSRLGRHLGVAPLPVPAGQADKVIALVALSVPFVPRDPAQRPVDALRTLYGDEYYVSRFQEPGAMEVEFARLGTETVLRKFLALRRADPLFIPYSGWVSPDDKVPVPSWISDEDIKYYTSEFDRTGFTRGLNYYRAWDETWELTAPWSGAEIKVPVKFIIVDLDLTYPIPWAQDFVCKGYSNKFVPLLDDVVIMKDVGHFINEEKPNEINELIINFINKFS